MEYLQSREMELGFSMIYTTDQKSNLLKTSEQSVF